MGLQAAICLCFRPHGGAFMLPVLGDSEGRLAYRSNGLHLGGSRSSAAWREKK